MVFIQNCITEINGGELAARSISFSLYGIALHVSMLKSVGVTHSDNCITNVSKASMNYRHIYFLTLHLIRMPDSKSRLPPNRLNPVYQYFTDKCARTHIAILDLNSSERHNTSRYTNFITSNVVKMHVYYRNNPANRSLLVSPCRFSQRKVLERRSTCSNPEKLLWYTAEHRGGCNIAHPRQRETTHAGTY